MLEAVIMAGRFELIDNHASDFKSVLLIEKGIIMLREHSFSPRIEQAIADIVAEVEAAR